MPPGIELKQGELITCESEHPFGRVLRDCEAGRDDWVEAIDWLQYVPFPGGPMTCNACGTRWIFLSHIIGDEANKRARIVINGMWRPPLDEDDKSHMAKEHA